MQQVFMIVFREGVEAFLIVAITFAFLKKTAQTHLLAAVRWGIAGSVVASGLLGYVLWLREGADTPLWEGVLALITAFLVVGLVVHMWKVGPHFKQDMEHRLTQATQTPGASYWGVFWFTVVMVSREGMEMVLMLLQVPGADIVTGSVLGVLAASVVAVLWQQFGYLINMKTFFKITSIFLLLFTAQVAFQAFHEFTEAGIFPNSDYLHEWSEPYSSDGLYGKQYANITFLGCALWLLASFMIEKIKPVSKTSARL